VIPGDRRESNQQKPVGGRARRLSRWWFFPRRMETAVMVLAMVILAAPSIPAGADSIPEVYVRNRPLPGALLVIDHQYYLPLEPLAQALGIPITCAGAGEPLMLNGKPLAITPLVRNHQVYVPLQPLAQVLNLRVIQNSQTGILDIYPPARTAAAAAASPRVAPSTPGASSHLASAPVIYRTDIPADYIIQDDRTARGLYQYAKGRIQYELGLTVSFPVVMNLTALKDFFAQDEDILYFNGIYLATGNPQGHERQIYIRNTMTRDECFWSLLHEYAHAIEDDQGLLGGRVMRGTAEGFAQWVAYKVCKSEGLNDLCDQELGRSSIYGLGLRVFIELEEARGAQGIILALREGRLDEMVRALLEP